MNSEEEQRKKKSLPAGEIQKGLKAAQWQPAELSAGKTQAKPSTAPIHDFSPKRINSAATTASIFRHSNSVSSKPASATDPFSLEATLVFRQAVNRLPEKVVHKLRAVYWSKKEEGTLSPAMRSAILLKSMDASFLGYLWTMLSPIEKAQFKALHDQEIGKISVEQADKVRQAFIASLAV